MIKYTVFCLQGDIEKITKGALSWGNVRKLGHGVVALTATAHDYNNPGGRAYFVTGPAISAEDAVALKRLFPELPWAAGEQIRNMGHKPSVDMAYVLGYDGDGDAPEGLSVIPASPASAGRLVLWQVTGKMGDIVQWVKKDEARTLITGPMVQPEVVMAIRDRLDITWTRGIRAMPVGEVAGLLSGWLTAVPTYQKSTAPPTETPDVRWRLFEVTLNDAAIMEKLHKAGIRTIAALLSVGSFTDLDGIGPSREQKINAALAASGIRRE